MAADPLEEPSGLHYIQHGIFKEHDGYAEFNGKWLPVGKKGRGESAVNKEGAPCQWKCKISGDATSQEPPKGPYKGSCESLEKDKHVPKAVDETTEFTHIALNSQGGYNLTGTCRYTELDDTGACNEAAVTGVMGSRDWRSTAGTPLTLWLVDNLKRPAAAAGKRKRITSSKSDESSSAVTRSRAAAVTPPAKAGAAAAAVAKKQRFDTTSSKNGSVDLRTQRPAARTGGTPAAATKATAIKATATATAAVAAAAAAGATAAAALQQGQAAPAELAAEHEVLEISDEEEGAVVKAEPVSDTAAGSAAAGGGGSAPDMGTAAAAIKAAVAPADAAAAVDTHTATSSANISTASSSSGSVSTPQVQQQRSTPANRLVWAADVTRFINALPADEETKSTWIEKFNEFAR